MITRLLPTIIGLVITMVMFSSPVRSQDNPAVACAEPIRLEACIHAADQGEAEAQFNLGGMYYRGDGVPQDYTEAIKWFRLAAEQGLAEAQTSLGAVYSEGLGVPQDDIEAVKWYRYNSERGHADAQYNLGVMYENGHGVLQDPIVAHMWLDLAGANGNADAREFRDFLQKDMTRKEIDEARKLAREWLEKHS